MGGIFGVADGINVTELVVTPPVIVTELDADYKVYIAVNGFQLIKDV